MGLPDYRQLSVSLKGSATPSTFSQITSDPTLAQALSTVYGGNFNNIDAWVGALAEDHVPGSSVGSLIKVMLESQFQRLRDGDRLFYRGNAAGLYTSGVLNPEIAAIIDLDNVTLADIILANTSIEHLQENLFFVPIAGDFNGDGAVDAADFVVWRKYEGIKNVWADGDSNGSVGPEDLALGAPIMALEPQPPAAERQIRFLSQLRYGCSLLHSLHVRYVSSAAYWR